MSLDDKLYQLDLILANQFEVLKLVSALLAREDKAIADFNLTQIEQCFNEKEKLNQQLHGLEIYRQQVVEAIEKTINKPSFHLTISSMSEYIDHPMIDAIQQRFHSFERELTQIKRAITKNKHLIQRSQFSIQQALGVMYEASEQGVHYNQNAKVQHQKTTETRLSVNI